MIYVCDNSIKEPNRQDSAQMAAFLDSSSVKALKSPDELGDPAWAWKWWSGYDRRGPN